MFIKLGSTLLAIAIFAFADVTYSQPTTPLDPVVIPTTPRGSVIVPVSPHTDYIDPPLNIRAEAVPARQLGKNTFAGLPIDALWAKILASDANAVIGIKAPGARRGVWKATRLISRADVESYVSRIEAMAGIDSITYRDPIMPFIVVRLTSRAALEAIRHLPYVDYVEPGNFELQPLFGCGRNAVSWNITIDTSGDIVPRAFPLNGIDRAWKRNVSGQGINIGVVDTGLYRDQQEFWPNRFSSVVSGERSIRYGNCTTQQCLDALPPSAFDECNHGTRIAGAIAAPRDGANIVGVAFRANLHAVKAANSVWTDPFIFNHLLGIRSVRNAGARIIEMAFGGVFTSFALWDEIAFQHYRTDRPEVLFVGAAGTGTTVLGISVAPPVVFPARLPEVLAVTGVNSDGSLAEGVSIGPEVDLAAVLVDFETTGETLGSVITLGGSSGASALVSGIAALVWSQNPAMTREHLINRLQGTAKRSGPLGIGIVDAYAATGGIRSARIIGPSGGVNTGQSFTLQASIVGAGPFSYLWDRGETSASVSRTGPGASSVSVRDLTDNNVIQLTFTAKLRRQTPVTGVSPKVCSKKPWTPGCDP